MTDASTINLNSGRLTRISFLDLPVPAELLGLTADRLSNVDWAVPTWVTQGQVNLGAAAWVLETADHRLVFDPMMALDLVLRADPETQRASEQGVAEAFAAQGLPIETIDQVLVSHVEDIGMLARQADNQSWQPFFPKATIRLSAAEISALQSKLKAEDAQPDQPAYAAWSALLEHGCVEPIEQSCELLPGVHADISAGHTPGHTVFHIGDPTSPEVSMIGHLAVSPVHMATGECADLNEDAAAAWRILHDNAADGRVLMGSLWPTPGYGRWTGERLMSESGSAG